MIWLNETVEGLKNEDTFKREEDDMSCGFVKQSFKVFCGNYGCNRRASWEVGNPQGPASLRLQLCQECAGELIASGIGAGLFDLPVLPEQEKIPEQPESTEEPESGVYPCEYCGKEFDNKKSCDMHSIRCVKRGG